MKTALKVLVIEDDRQLLSALADTIKQQGYAVISTQDGEEGLELAISAHPDLILLDLQLPKLDGHELLKILRKDKLGQRIPVIILTNDESPVSINETLDKAAPAYFIKAETSLASISAAIHYHLAPA
jgi:DNA-binding response OmpR family regulator